MPTAGLQGELPLTIEHKAGHRSGGRALSCKDLDPPARWIDPTLRIHFAVWAILRSNQWSTTGLSETVVCAVLSVGKSI